MAKVTGPLFSMSAAGQIGKSLVFASWKGVNYVREYIIPSNPQSADQGNQRLFLGGTSKALAKIVVPSDFHSRFSASIPSGQSWNSYCGAAIINNILVNQTAYEALVTEFEGHTANADWDSAAAGLGLVDFSIEYAGTEEAFVAGLQLYIIAKLGFYLGFLTEPFDTALASWTATEIGQLVTEMTTVA